MADEYGGMILFCDVISVILAVPDVLPLSRKGTMWVLLIVKILCSLDISYVLNVVRVVWPMIHEKGRVSITTNSVLISILGVPNFSEHLRT